VSSSESAGAGEGSRGGDWKIVDPYHVLLAAVRDRSYRIEVIATDEAGNTATSSVAVRVGR
jgi:hypothetical protein